MTNADTGFIDGNKFVDFFEVAIYFVRQTFVGFQTRIYFLRG